jgi:STE24 endopeptidase
MHFFSFIFLAAVTLNLLLRQWLATRQINYVRRHRAQVPSDFSTSIPLEAHQLAADYTMSRVRFSRIEISFEALILIGWTLGGGLEMVDHLWRTIGWPPLLAGSATILSVIIISSLLEQPFSIWRTFVIEAHYGFNRTRPSTYIGDLIKQGLLLFILGLCMGSLDRFQHSRSLGLSSLYRTAF